MNASARAAAAALFGAFLAGCPADVLKTDLDPEPDPEPVDVSPRAKLPSESFHPRHPGDPPVAVLGAGVEVVQFRLPCKVAASWRIGGASGTPFRVVYYALEGGVFPLPRGVLQVEGSHDILHVPGGHPLPPKAELIPNPPTFANLAIRPGDVAIPVEPVGEAVLDGDSYAKAQINTEGPDAGVPNTANVLINTWMHRGLHVGDSFAWGARSATVVRIVAPVLEGREGPVGWVEVSLASGAGEDQHT